MIKYLILLTILGGPVSAQDRLGLFDTAFSPLIEAEINKFDFQLGEDPNAPQGDFSFKKFRFVSPSTQASMDNDSHFYDSKVYYNGELFGFQGPGASFVYKLRETDKKYFDTVEWISMENTYLLMDENGINLRGDKFGQKGKDAFIFGANFNLECDRHPEHMLNDGNGFLAGCLNSGSVQPLNGGGIGTEYHFYNEENKKIIDIKGFVSELETTQETFTLNAISADANFSDEIGVTGSDVTVSCAKPSDILNLGIEEFVLPCMKDIQAKGNILNIKYFEDNDKMSLTSPSLKSFGESFNIKFQSLKFQTVDSDFSLSPSEINCQTPEGDLLEVETYLKGCLNDANIKSPSDVLSYEFNQKDEGDDPLDFHMNGKLGQVFFSNNKIKLDSPRTNLSVGNEVFVNLNDVKLNCQKVEELDKFEAKSILDYCKKEMYLESSSVQIKDFADRSKPIVADVKVGQEGAISQQGVLSLRMDSIKLADTEDLTLMKDVVVDCETLKQTD
ncbi:MAG: hypothetical protein NXH75_03665, partial [Halobacteriovoraceae bacterium]|nr:hypothetical protein [Halobacteriovoraceae bacterium]